MFLICNKRVYFDIAHFHCNAVTRRLLLFGVCHAVSEDDAGLFILQGVKPASYSKVSDPEIKEIIGECICHRWEER